MEGGKGSHQRRNIAQILNELPHFFTAGFIVWGAQNGGGMYGGHYHRREGGLHNFASMLGYAKLAAEQRLGCGRSQTHDDPGFDRRNFRIQPRPAGGDFRCVGFFVDSPLATRLPFEMLYRVGDIDCFAINSGFRKRAV